jgi:hypothetical protein
MLYIADRTADGVCIASHAGSPLFCLDIIRQREEYIWPSWAVHGLSLLKWLNTLEYLFVVRFCSSSEPAIVNIVHAMLTIAVYRIEREKMIL